MKVCIHLQVFMRTFMYTGYLLNSLTTAIFDDFSFIREIYFKNFNCNLSHKNFSTKSFSLKSALFILDDKIFTVPHISLPLRLSAQLCVQTYAETYVSSFGVILPEHFVTSE